MPTFESLIMAAPAGFSQGSSSLNSFVVSDEETFAQLVAKSLKDSSFTAADHVDKNHSGHFKVISFIIRAYRSANPTPTAQQMAVALDQNTLLTRDCVEKLIVAVQNNQTNDTTSSVSLLTQLSGKMQNLKWKVGVAMSSSACKSLSSPYVALNFDIKEVDGSFTHHSCELTYDEFQQLKSAFERAAFAMDGV